LQFRIAAGEKLPLTQNDIHQQGHAIECRVYAEDPHNNFLPAIGPVLRFLPPEGPGIRVDSGIQSGDEITIHYDPMIAKVIVHAPSRDEAIARMKQALDETVILGTRWTPALWMRIWLPCSRNKPIYRQWLSSRRRYLI
jgi:acetyl/propionyl-CoA carboxylase alpha subunit